jgi:asparagine synthase (glutamine-hydrolysing)
MHYQLTSGVPDTFTVGFTPPRQQTQSSEFNEIENAASVAGQFGANHISECYTPEQVLGCLPDIIKALDEPLADPIAIPLWFATRLAHQSGVKVLFSGKMREKVGYLSVLFISDDGFVDSLRGTDFVKKNEKVPKRNAIV